MSADWHRRGGDPGLTRLAGPGSLPCRHGPGDVPRPLDEGARRLSHEELAVGRLLESEGHTVRSLPERPRLGRRADLSVCGWWVEVKSLTDLGQRLAGPPDAVGVANQLLRARGQGQLVVLWGGTSGVRPEVALEGFELFRRKLVATGWGGVCGTRLIGDGFDLGVSSPRLWRGAVPGVLPAAARADLYRRPPGPGPGPRLGP